MTALRMLSKMRAANALWACAASVLLTLFGCTVPAPFRVLSFNIRYATADDGPDAWEFRRDFVVETIRAQNADVLGLQEVLSSQAAELRAALPEYGFVGVGRDDGAEKGEFVPIFFRRQRFALVDSGCFWLSERPEQVGSVGWDAALPRIVTWARLRFKDAPLSETYVINVHLDHRGTRARTESARLVRRLVESLGGQPVIVLGDFNCPPDAEPYRILTEVGDNLAGLRDALAGLDPKDSGTYHAFTGEPRGGRIDWILVSRRYEPSAGAIDRRARDGRYPSDHFPVAATLRLPAAWSPHW